MLAAIDGFYEAVAQQITPWTARAPQLPKGGRTAAEEAGLDLVPPPLDQQAEAKPPRDLVDSPDGATPDVVVEATREVEDTDGQAPTTDTEMPRPSGDPVEPDGSLVSWDVAHEKLDHERRADDEQRAYGDHG